MNLRTRKLWLWLSFALAGALFLFRFLHLPHAPFLNDEPRLLNAVEESYRVGAWPSIGPMGSQPIPHWFYHVFVFFVVQLLLVVMVWRSFGRIWERNQ
jgi:hypothetical protein